MFITIYINIIKHFFDPNLTIENNTYRSKNIDNYILGISNLSKPGIYYYIL